MDNNNTNPTQQQQQQQQHQFHIQLNMCECDTMARSITNTAMRMQFEWFGRFESERIESNWMVCLFFVDRSFVCLPFCLCPMMMMMPQNQVVAQADCKKSKWCVLVVRFDPRICLISLTRTVSLWNGNFCQFSKTLLNSQSLLIVVMLLLSSQNTHSIRQSVTQSENASIRSVCGTYLLAYDDELAYCGSCKYQLRTITKDHRRTSNSIMVCFDSKKTLLLETLNGAFILYQLIIRCWMCQRFWLNKRHNNYALVEMICINILYGSFRRFHFVCWNARQMNFCFLGFLATLKIGYARIGWSVAVVARWRYDRLCWVSAVRFTQTVKLTLNRIFCK